jgi:hypothetical protein
MATPTVKLQRKSLEFHVRRIVRLLGNVSGGGVVHFDLHTDARQGGRTPGQLASPRGIAVAIRTSAARSVTGAEQVIPVQT